MQCMYAVSFIYYKKTLFYQNMLLSVTIVHTNSNALELDMQVYVIMVSVSVSQDTYWLGVTVTKVKNCLISCSFWQTFDIINI